jgi:hypothetical protein
MNARAAALVLVALLALGGCAREEAAAPASAAPIAFAAPDPFADAMWDDGRAEFAVYRGTIERYGITRPLAAKLIVVKEDFDPAAGVKSDAGPVEGRTHTVFKVVTMLEFPTGTYSYRQVATTFLDRETGALTKLAMSSTEACGITYVQVTSRKGAWRHLSHSYFEGEGDRDLILPLRADRPAVAADGLALWLRRLDLAKAQSIAVDLLPSQLSSRVRATALVPATIEVVGVADTLGWPVLVKSVDASGAPVVDRWWFDRAAPHGLVRFEGADSRTLERTKVVRLAYWEATKPGDEVLLAP